MSTQNTSWLSFRRLNIDLHAAKSQSVGGSTTWDARVVLTEAQIVALSEPTESTLWGRGEHVWDGPFRDPRYVGVMRINPMGNGSVPGGGPEFALSVSRARGNPKLDRASLPAGWAIQSVPDIHLSLVAADDRPIVTTIAAVKNTLAVSIFVFPREIGFRLCLDERLAGLALEQRGGEGRVHR